MAGTKPRYHPWLFLLMTLVAIAELGLTAFLIDAGNASHTWPTPRYHSLYVKLLIEYNKCIDSVRQVDFIPFQCRVDDYVRRCICIVDHRRGRACAG